MRWGIDLGTTRTVVAAVDDGRHPIATFDEGGAHREWIPGVCAEIDGERRHGWDAVAILPAADAVVRSVKRTISGLAPDDPIDALPSRPTALELLAEHAAHVVDRARRSSSLEVEETELVEAMIAVPANATSRQRWATIEAFRRAGVHVLGVLNEPTAAGIEFAHRHLGAQPKKSPKKYVVVYDLGGGTFDTSAISLRGQRFDLLATEGIARLGGDDFDEAILALALARAGVDRAGLGSAVTARLLDQARAAKESMGERSKHVLVDLGVALEGAGPVVLEAAAVLDACEPLVERSIAMLERLFAALPAHGIDPGDGRQLGAVYVVGGGASFAGVQRALRARLGKKVQLASSPHAATAIGLAVAADEAAGVYVQESVTRHFGVWREAVAGREKIFDPIFPKDARASEHGDLVVQRRYRPRHTVGHLRFLECSALDVDGGPSGDLTPSREILFPYDPSLRDRGDLDLDRVIAPDVGVAGEEIEETYRYGASGEITVRIANLTHGYERTYELGRLG